MAGMPLLHGDEKADVPGWVHPLKYVISIILFFIWNPHLRQPRPCLFSVFPLRRLLQEGVPRS